MSAAQVHALPVMELFNRSTIWAQPATSCARHKLSLGAPISRSAYILALHLVLLFATILPVYSDNILQITLDPITPPPSQCEPFTFRWTGGMPPFFVSLFPQDGIGQRNLGPTNEDSFTWDTDFPAGTTLHAQVSGTDSESDESSTFVVQSGLSSTCLGIPPTAGQTTASMETPGQVFSTLSSNIGGSSVDIISVKTISPLPMTDSLSLCPSQQILFPSLQPDH